ncbi:DUF2635 domain-containing protein [Pseudomonas sp. D47]|uniref:DUF2635 domain-containing protein n=1 Tax=Pseudomonas sp. D47 TaxID=3159447 RepID=UPI00387B7AB0
MNKSAPESELVSIKPLRDLRVRKPNGQVLKTEGESVVWSAYWRRRELEGDIECVKTKVKTGRAPLAPPSTLETATE